jgi:hypothetical protein
MQGSGLEIMDFKRRCRVTHQLLTRTFLVHPLKMALHFMYPNIFSIGGMLIYS